MAYRAFPSTRPRTPRSYPTTLLDNPLVFDSVAFQSNWQGIGFNYALLNSIPGYGLTAQQIATDVARVVASGAKYVSTWVDQGWSMPSYPSGSADWNSADMTGFWAGWTAMANAGIKVAPRCGWHFPQNVGALSGAAPITPTVPQEAIFAQWVSDFLDQVLNVRGYTNLSFVQLFTEPTTSKGTIPGGYANGWDYYAHIAGVVRAKIASDDGGRTPVLPRITLLGPGEFSYTADPWLEGVKADDPNALDAYAAHSYYGTPGFAPYSMAATNAAGYQAWIDLFSNWVGDASSKVLVADETGFLTGDTDPNDYTRTADYGWQLARQIEGHMQAGCAASWPWLLEDQPILGAVLEYGSLEYIGTSSAAKPGFKAVSMLAGLTGGAGTALYRILGSTATLHGTGCVLPSGDITIVVMNEGAAPIRTGFTFKTALSSARTFYRYTYSGEIPTDTTATTLSWDMTLGGYEIQSTVIPARSVVCFSTINMSSPTWGTNLALSATATTDSAGYGDVRNIIDGNFSNVQGAYNGWRKTDDSSHYAELSWPSTQTVARVRIALVGTTAGQVYADYATTTVPTVMADYVLSYRNTLGSLVTLATVTGNTNPNPSHTFAAVQATAIRLTITSVAATAQVNQIGVYGS